jgi:glycine C-acetyltransferase
MPPTLGSSQPSRPGLDFATQDYLALATHPALRAAALAAVGEPRFSPTGLSAPVSSLEARLAAFLGQPAAVCFRSGSEAIRQTFGALLRPKDHVILDAGAHPTMAESVLVTGAQLHRSPPASVEAVERRLARLARQPRHGRLFIATPAVSAYASRIADLAELTALARCYDATLIVDTTHDLGALGPDGAGLAEIQGCISRIDVLVGSFSKTFGAVGGYVAFRDQTLRSALPPAQALSPVNASVILAALEIILGPEGRRRRRNLHGLSLRLRNHLMADGVKIMGKASPFVPILLPSETALPRTALVQSAGPQLELLQAPKVPLHAPRWRVNLSASHGPADIDDLAELIRDVSRAFDRARPPTRVPA